MSKGQPLKWMPNNPLSGRFFLVKKFTLGIICLTFFLNYQPAFQIPPLKTNLVHAQTEQSQVIQSQASLVDFQLPHPGYISTHFSSYHPGIDLATGLGMPIKPIAKGTVVDTGFNFWGLGLMVVVDHGQGYKSTYGHMGKIYVSKGQEVGTSDYLGEVGLTGHTSGPHTHLELAKDNVNIDPLTVLPKIRDYPEASDFQPVGGRANLNPFSGQTNLENKPASSPKPTPTPTPALFTDLNYQNSGNLLKKLDIRK